MTGFSNWLLRMFSKVIEMSEVVELFLTKKKPSKGLYGDGDDLFVGNEYLYTSSGNVKRWWIAIKMVFKEKEQPHKSIKLKIEEAKK